MPLLTIITRTCDRPHLLARNQAMLECQQEKDFEVKLIKDDKGRGLYWANRQIAKARGTLKGRYVWILDDDDFCLSDSFVWSFKVNQNIWDRPDVVVAKGWILEKQMPTPRTWYKFPVRGEIAAPNVIVKRELFDKYCHLWNRERAGDFAYISGIFSGKPSVRWWEKFIFYADPSCGHSEAEKCQLNEALQSKVKV